MRKFSWLRRTVARMSLRRDGNDVMMVMERVEKFWNLSGLLLWKVYTFYFTTCSSLHINFKSTTMKTTMMMPSLLPCYHRCRGRLKWKEKQASRQAGNEAPTYIRLKLSGSKTKSVIVPRDSFFFSTAVVVYYKSTLNAERQLTSEKRHRWRWQWRRELFRIYTHPSTVVDAATTANTVSEVEEKAAEERHKTRLCVSSVVSEVRGEDKWRGK